MKKSQKAVSGFTIVELLVVIVVIAILAAITIVSYNGITTKAQDSRRKSELSSIANAFRLAALDANGDIMGAGSGCGYLGSATGYFAGEYTNSGVSYPSIRQCLADVGFPGVAKLGGNPDSYMKLDCKLNGIEKSYLLGRIYSEPQNASMIEGLCNPVTAPGWGDVSFWDDRYGMNYYIELK